MPQLQQSIKAVNLIVLMFFFGCAYYNMLVYSQSPPSNAGALTVVDSQADDDDDDGVVSVEENGENEKTGEPGETHNVFYPTKEWKTVKEGQAIPRGLHVKMNMQTGEKQAKLVEDDLGLKYWKSGERQGMVNADKKSFSREELKEALKEFKSTDDGGGQDPEAAKKVKEKYRSYSELKKEFESMNMAIKTDSEIIMDLVERLKKAHPESDVKKVVLEELEYHLHKIDNAQLFCDLGGMPLLVSCLNASSTAIQAEAALVMGSALQSNPKVQVTAIEHGAMHSLVKLLSTTPSASLQKMLLYALSSLSRHFPYAQKKLLELGGLSALKDLFSNPSPEGQKLQIKAVTFLNDLLVEQDSIEKHTKTEDTVAMQRLNQYREVNLRSFMQESGWCEVIPRLLTSPDHDAREKVLHAMVTLVPQCGSTFTSVISDLEKLKVEYEKLALSEKEEGDDYFSGVLDLVSTMLTSVQLRDEL